MSLKIAANAVSVTVKSHFNDQLHLRPPADHLDNAKFPNMNNIMSIDYANKDQTHDIDMILARWSQEYPKLATNFTSKDSQNKPWGKKSDPIFFDHTIDSRMMNKWEKGVWHHSNV